MDVGNGLAGGGPGVQDEPISLTFDAQSPGDFSPKENQLTGQLRICLGQLAECPDVAFGNDQDVRWGLRLGVRKGEEGVAFTDDLGGDVPRGNPAKHALGHLSKTDVEDPSALRSPGPSGNI
jgi:hypothetical protein